MVGDLESRVQALTMEPTLQEVPVVEVLAGEVVDGAMGLEPVQDASGAVFAVVDVRIKEIAAIEEINLRGQRETTRGLFMEARVTLDEAVSRARELRQGNPNMPEVKDVLEEVVFKSACTAREMDMTAV